MSKVIRLFSSLDDQLLKVSDIKYNRGLERIGLGEDKEIRLSIVTVTNDISLLTLIPQDLRG